MNLITDLIARIEEYRATNKNPCKSYKTEKAAEKAAAEYAHKIAAYYSDNPDTLERPQYLVFYNQHWGRYCVAFNVTDLLNKYGGYIGFASNCGFFTYR